MMGEFLKAVCAERGFTAVTLAHNTGTSYPFGAFVHTSAGHCGHGTGETVEAAVQVAISDLHARLPNPELALAVASLDDRHACKERVLSALTEIIKFETDPVFAKLAQRRFLDITDKETANV